jgi:hypothetical protein
MTLKALSFYSTELGPRSSSSLYGTERDASSRRIGLDPAARGAHYECDTRVQHLSFGGASLAARPFASGCLTRKKSPVVLMPTPRWIAFSQSFAKRVQGTSALQIPLPVLARSSPASREPPSRPRIVSQSNHAKETAHHEVEPRSTSTLSRRWRVPQPLGRCDWRSNLPRPSHGAADPL